MEVANDVHDELRYCGIVLSGANRLGVCFGETPTGDLICGFDLGEKRLDFQDVVCRAPQTSEAAVICNN